MGILNHEDWSLDRRGQSAQARHREKVKDAIRNNLSDLISDQGIILSDGERKVRIPVRSLDEPHFFYDNTKQSRVGQGEGETGKAIGRADSGQPGQGAGGAGENPGELVSEAEVTLEEVEEAVFADLELPNLEDKRIFQQQAEGMEFNDLRPKGIMGNLDRRHTLLEALRRSRKDGQDLVVREEDLRFKTWDTSPRPTLSAVVIAMMDVSGSMGSTEKYISRTFFYWLERFLKSRYDQVELRFLVHHVKAYETTREQFYSIRESGGTVCSSVFQAALDMVHKDYPVDDWNIYPIYVGDGDNLIADNERARQLVQQLASKSSLFGYVEVNLMNRPASLMGVLENLDESHFRAAAIANRWQVLNALRKFFSQEVSAV